MTRAWLGWLVVLAPALSLPGCVAPTSPLVAVPLVSCEPALRAAFAARGPSLDDALRDSIAWFDDPRSHAYYPRSDPALSHDAARNSVAALLEIVTAAPDADAFIDEVGRRFDAYRAAGADGDGVVLFTAYFAPEYAASRVRAGRYVHPIYMRPPHVPEGTRWHARRVIEEQGLLHGHELAWLRDPIDAYLVHVNGSARLRFADGDILPVTHAGTNERPYTSLGRLLVDAGIVPPSEISMQAIRAAHTRAPARVEALMLRNERFVFFRASHAEAWPVSDLGVPLTAECSLATDKAVFPPGCPVLVDTRFCLTDKKANAGAFTRLMLDHDRGGAITGPGRADLFLGVGDDAGAVAGRVKATGAMYYLLLKE